MTDRGTSLPVNRNGLALLWLSVAFFVGLCVTSLFTMLVAGGGRVAFMWGAAVQDVLVFVCPALLMAFVAYGNVRSSLSLDRGGDWRSWAVAALVMVAGIPFMNQLVWWNEQMQLPDSLAPLEQAMRQMEEAAQAMTSTILNVDSFWAMLANVALVGVLTGLSEELFFRAALQKVIARMSGRPVVAIWIAAFIFSLLHFQFYGFIPRLLLGAFFGYLLYWSGSLWVSAAAHAFNNSIVAIGSWCVTRGWATEDFLNFGVGDEGISWTVAFSLVAIVAALLLHPRKSAQNG